MKIIMISAHSQNGKDAVANIMKEQLEQKEQRVLIVHFADLVKFYATQYFNWDGNKDERGRALLQKIGTTIMRERWPTYWAEIIAKFIDALGDDIYDVFFDYVIIPDWRFINEFETVYDYARLFHQKVTTIRVNRYNEDGTLYWNPQMTLEQRQHISECELDNFNFEWIVSNRGTLDDLRDSIKVILDNI